MHKLLNKLTPEWTLRTGLGVMYFYSSIDIIRHPTGWFWALRPVFRFFPAAMQADFTKPAFMKKFLMVQGTIELAFALILLAWFLPKKWAKCVAGLVALEMAGILLLIPIDAVTFRDFGLLGAGLALYLILKGESKNGEKVIQKSLSPEVKPGETKVETYEDFMKK